MNIAISEFLKNMVQNEGPDWLLEEARVCACLADMFPKFKRERSILRMSIRMGYPSKLEQSINDQGFDNRKVIIQKLAQEFCDEGWITQEAALYAVNILAYAKGYLQEYTEPEDAIDSEYYENLIENVNALEKENQMLRQQNQRLQQQNDALQEKLPKQTKVNDSNVTKESWRGFIHDEDLEQIKIMIKKDSDLMVKCSKLFLTSQNMEIVALGEDLLFVAAQKQCAEAQMLLGEWYYRNRDAGSAYIWFERSAKNGNKIAAYKLGTMYGMSGKYSDAVRWLKIAAESGVADAQLDYGILLQSGIGIEKNQQLALYWFQKSANAGNEEAIEKYKKLLEEIMKKQ
jgi:hypothetical protein